MKKKTDPTKKGVDTDAILTLLNESDYTPLSATDMAARLDLRGGEIQALRRQLRQMTLNGDIALVRQNRYTLGSPADLVTGRLDVARSKMGFVEASPSGERIRVFPEHQGTALPGDTVTVRLDAGAAAARGARDGLRTGRVIRILERARRWIVGTLRSTGRFWYVVPIDPAYDKDFYVPDPRDAAINDRVVIQFVEWDNRHVNPEGEIVEVIGPADVPTNDTLAIIRHYDLPDDFPAEVLRDAEQAAGRLNEPGRRHDFRDAFVFTVDPETARDFDDALSLETDAQGRRVLGVHIADVAHFVRHGGALDREAYQRGNSVYLPDRVLPMLPEQLSNGLCSLRPDEDRLAFSAWITVDDHGTPLSWRFDRSIIRSRARLTYEQALTVVQQPAGTAAPALRLDADQADTLREVHRLAQQLRQRRFAANALDLDVPEWDVRIDRGGLITAILPRVNDVSHQMIEECMIAANEAVDTELSRRGLPLLHRVHEPPSEKKLDELTAELRAMGLQPGDLRHRRNMVQFLRSIADHPLKRHIHIAMLKSMKRAAYATTADGHFGLAKKYYAHFTSPIRRYPDLIVHRILAAALRGRGGGPRRPELEAAAVHCSDTERKAEEAERALIEIKKYRYLQQALQTKPPPVFTAYVVSAVNFGLFVELAELQIQGLIHVSEIAPEFVAYDSARQTLRARGQTYRAGMAMEVRVARVDFDKRQVDFVPADQPVNNAAARTKRPAAGKPRRPSRRRAARNSS